MCYLRSESIVNTVGRLCIKDRNVFFMMQTNKNWF